MAISNGSGSPQAPGAKGLISPEVGAEILSSTEYYSGGEEVELYCSECGETLAVYDVSGFSTLVLFTTDCPHFELREYPSNEWPDPDVMDRVEKVLEGGGRVYVWLRR